MGIIDVIKQSKVDFSQDPLAVWLKRRELAQVVGGGCLPECEICHGVGWVGLSSIPTDHPGFGKLYPCPNYRLAGDRVGMEPDDMALSWSSLLEWSNAKQGQAAVTETLQRGAGWVYLWGGPGLAKTLILKIAIAEALRQGKAAAYVRMTDLLDNLRSAYDEKNPSAEAERRLDFWREIPVLAIDEFDRANDTPWVKEKRFNLMDKRYQAAEKGKAVTLLSSNVDPANFEAYLVDRIFDKRFVVLEMQGVSFRTITDWTV